MTTPPRVEITLFPQGKRIAVTTSWDDGHTFDRRIVAAFNEWGIKGTFNLNSGALQRKGVPAVEDGKRTHLDASEVKELYAGHEVAIHTVTHPWLHRLDPSQIALEVLEDRKALEDLVEYPVRGMAYPFGAFDKQVIEVLRALGIVYCRTTQQSPNCFPPEEPLAWATTGHQYISDPDVPARFQKLVDNTRYYGVFFIWGHGFEFHDRNDWDALERLFKPISACPDAWYCTNIELFDYEAARRRMAISANRATAYNPNAIPVTLNVGGKLIDAPPGKVISL